MTLSRDDLGELLELVERAEDPLLSWGVVDGGLSERELEELVERWLDEHDPLGDVDDTIDSLLGAGLLHHHTQHGGSVYRSRMAEGIRLLTRLRQLFPISAATEGGWRGAATLVGGFRYLRRPRRYPRRDINPGEVLSAISTSSSLRRRVGQGLTDGLLLSGFQQRAAQQILDDVRTSTSRGVIVGVGTGAGKTLAFYLPAYMIVGELVDEDHWTKVVALYPRNELLKDQLQTAVEQALRVREHLVSNKGRPLRIGVLFGDVPHNVGHLRGRYKPWPTSGQNTFLCPYLRCPAPGARDGGAICHGELILTAEGYSRGDEGLRCSTCGFVLSADDFGVTREQLRDRPPDVLFCSSEMLNRGLLDPESQHVIGVGAHRAPVLVLLDEVHTYGGATGASTALLLRRWRRRLQPAQPAFVGLSATLIDAGPFFADLIGLDEDRVTSVEANDDELVPEGAEHLLAIRSDPVSGAGVLSTSIQAAMLLGRILDPVGQGISEGLYGSKVFCFTDDLDVTNRLYFDLLDAEGLRAQPSAANDKVIRPSLAHLRHPAHGDNPTRRTSGQLWELPIALGHGLTETDRLEVQRVSSQDAGVDSRKPLVVATASLEVGFDDPDVGAVIQHRAPRDIASFLQRRGRAGRPRGMRPITAVVLSDYGRDRQAYESWDRLFDPVLPARRLPVANIHVLRMQATAALLEWIALELKADSGNLWQDLKGPNTRRDQYGAQAKHRQQEVGTLLRRLLSSPDLQHALRMHLQESLQVDAGVAEELLWHPPRAILLSAVPALLRRLETDWTTVTVDGSGELLDRGAGQPLPEFMPANLFSNLALPEMILRLPVGPPGREFEDDEQPMGLVQGLREFAPGRVSRRFAIRSGLDRHWIAPPSDAKGRLDIATFVTAWRRDGTITVGDEEARTELPLLRPTGLQASRPPDDVRDSSNARPVWRSQLVPAGRGAELPVIIADPVGQALRSLTAFLHRDHAEVEARRGTVGADARLAFKGGSDQRVTTCFTDGDHDVALGGVFDVDALRAQVRVAVDAEVWSGQHGAGLRSAWFHHVITSDPHLGEKANPFLLGWLHDVVLTTLLAEADRHEQDLQDAWRAVRGSLTSRLEHAMEILLASPGLRIDEIDVDAGPARLHGELHDLLQDGSVAERLDAHAPALWTAPDLDTMRWTERRLQRTLGEAMLAAAALLCPAHDPEGVVVDVEPGYDDTGQFRNDEVWLCETSIGGGGFLEAVAETVSRDPVRFQRLVRTCLRPGIDQRIGSALQRVLDAAVDDTPVQGAFAAYRAATTMGERVERLANLRTVIADIGVPPVSETVAAVTNRLLPPGSDAKTDSDVHASLHRWQEMERRLGVEIEVRTWCFLDASRSGPLDRQMLDTLQLVLWPRGWRLRASNLSTWNPFDDAPPSAPQLLEALLGTHDPVMVDLTGEGDGTKVTDALRAHAVVDVRVTAAERMRLAQLLAYTAVNPVDLEYLQLYPRLAQVREEDDGCLVARLELPEAA